VASNLSAYGAAYENLNERVQSVFIELEDIAAEFEVQQDSLEANPQVLEQVNSKLKLLYDLQRKHNVSDIEELLSIQEELSKKVGATENIEDEIKTKEQELLVQKERLEASAKTLSTKRKKALPKLKQQLQKSLAPLGMPSASFQIEVAEAEDFKVNGKDDLSFLFSGNKGIAYGELKKVASGGELSRIMLVIKSILANYENLPTIMFDEIDTGVSGEVSDQMGDIMYSMSKSMQVFSITHLPQVASKGNHHYKVFKEEDGSSTQTRMKQLSNDERVVELAEMLGGKSLTDSAMAHARQLLN